MEGKGREIGEIVVDFEVQICQRHSEQWKQRESILCFDEQFRRHIKRTGHNSPVPIFSPAELNNVLESDNSHPADDLNNARALSPAPHQQEL